MPIFATAPLILRESLIFPYVSGAEFMRWWAQTGHPPLPGRGELPMSTEQVLHPDRYPADQPVTVRFEDSTAKVLFEDTFGELETQILLASFGERASPGSSSQSGGAGIATGYMRPRADRPWSGSRPGMRSHRETGFVASRRRVPKAWETRLPGRLWRPSQSTVAPGSAWSIVRGPEARRPKDLRDDGLGP
jgi:hypothetical protein